VLFQWVNKRVTEVKQAMVVLQVIGVQQVKELNN
jgi:hypothetical protein